MRIAMIGTGYVGLVSGACFSELGHSVACVDMDEGKVAALTARHIPIYEPELDAMVAENSDRGRLSFTTDLASAVSGAEAVFIAVGTPSRAEDGDADLSHVYAAAGEVAAALDGATLVVTKSTVPVGTGREITRIIAKARPDADFDVASNPEFLREGSAIKDFMHPDRVVIGAASERARQVMRDIYKPLEAGGTPLFFTTLETAELIKYAANAFLAAKITFINEIADLCEAVGADVEDVATGIGLDKRIGPKFLAAGPGFGGSCFPKDTLALLGMGRQHGVEQSIVEAVVAVNDRRKRAMAGRVVAACGGSIEGKTIAILGLTFKPDTDDMRDSPAIDIVGGLQAAGAVVRAFDPEGMEEAGKCLDDVAYCDDAYEAMDDADALVIVTDWEQFRGLDLDRVKSLLRQPVFVDLRNLYAPDDMARAGFRYHCIGRT